jgi:periplasmic protein TonB
MKFPARLVPFCILCLITSAAAVYARGRGQEQPPTNRTMPVVLSEVKPDYTPEAKQRGIQGNVELSVVVKDDGTVGEVKVTQSLDDKYGLDDQAVIAMKKWRFRPGTRDGKPVAVQVTVEMSFKLR